MSLKTFLRQHWPLLIAVSLAAVLRWLRLGAEPFHDDENFIMLKAIFAARHHELQLEGPPMSIGLWHSPLSVYLYALPLLVSLDMRAVRAFTGLLNVIAVGLVYVIGNRYFDRKAAFVAAFLYAIHPEAVTVSRIINNAQLGAPFVMLYVLTGLAGYYEDKRWARLLHLPMFSLAGQCHPYVFMAAPVSLMFLGNALWNRRERWRSLSLQFVLSGLLAAILMIPWGLGFYRSTGLNIAGVASDTPVRANYGAEYTLKVVFDLIGGSEASTRLASQLLAVAGGVWLTVRASRGRRDLPGLTLILTFALVPFVSWLVNLYLVADYLWSVFPCVFLIQGALIGGVLGQAEISVFWKWNGLLNDRYLRWLTAPLVAVIVFAQIQFSVTLDRRYDGVSLNQQLAAVETAANTARQTGQDLLIFTTIEQRRPMEWEVLRELQQFKNGQQFIVVYDGRGMPLPQHGALLFAPIDYASRPFVFSGGQILEEAYRLTLLPAADHFQPDLLPLTPIRFDNGALALGFLRESPDDSPAPGQPWTIFLIWQIERPSEKEYSVFVHVVDDAGNKYAQIDSLALPVGQQQSGRRVLTQLAFQFGAGLPPTGPLYLRFGMANETGQAHVLDESGMPREDFALIQIRGQAQPLARLADGVTLDQLRVNSPLMQGPPLEVTATWRLTHQPQGDIRWRLIDSAGKVIISHNTPLATGLSIPNRPFEMFTTTHHSLRLPTDLAAGIYTLEATLGEGRYQSPIEITARDRRFTPPPMAHPLEATFDQQIKLLGYDLQLEGRNLSVVLHWQAIGQIERDYKYFVHIWRDGKVVTQADAMPGAYQYLTSWWGPDEVFSETATLDLSTLSPGSYLITTGFYDPGNGERLPIFLLDGSEPKDRWLALQNFDFK